MKHYKGWSPERRKASLKLTNKAKKMGWIPQPKICRRCGQDKGILHLHNEDYDVTYYTLRDVFNSFPVTIMLSPQNKYQLLLCFYLQSGASYDISNILALTLR